MFVLCLCFSKGKRRTLQKVSWLEVVSEW